MQWLVPAGIAAGSLALTYIVCLRPMRRGHCMLATVSSSDDDGANREEIARLRSEVKELRGTYPAVPDRITTEPALTYRSLRTDLLGGFCEQG